MNTLADKVALVTGSSRSIGAAIARLFAAQGGKVAVHGRDRDALSRVRSDIEQKGGRAIQVEADVRKFAEVEEEGQIKPVPSPSSPPSRTASQRSPARPGSATPATQGSVVLLRVWRFVALVLAALALTMESAHVLELPQKMRYDAQMYAAVNTTLYRYFAVVGGVYQVTSIVAAGILVWLVRKRHPSFRWTLTGLLCLLSAFGIWLAVVAPVNREVSEALRSAPESVPALWMQLRQRWEYGHASGFVAQLVGLGALVLSVVLETPHDAPRNRVV